MFFHVDAMFEEVKIKKSIFSEKQPKQINGYMVMSVMKKSRINMADADAMLLSFFLHLTAIPVLFIFLEKCLLLFFCQV